MEQETYEEDDEQAFMEGYNDDEETPECEECGGAVREKSVKRDIDGETHTFCSNHCADEFEESLG
jgi:hypothetical protein